VIEMPTEADPVKVIEGDCLDVLPELAAVGCEFTLITDPPYGVGLGIDNDPRTGGGHLGKKGYANDPDTYESFVSDVVPRLNVAIDLAKRAAVFTGPNIHEQRKPTAIGGIHHPAAVGRTTWGFKSFLPVLFYGTSPDRHKGSYPTMLRSTATVEKNGHPCPKPLEWMRWLVRLATRPGDLIIDPFAGSGTTGIAAAKEGRRCILIEKDASYAAICRKRVAKALDAGLFAVEVGDKDSLIGD
jgi:site-specific DNA-methyltransferase (adenine-specific)